MNKPKNYENTQAGGDFTPIELGGHILEIKQVEEVWSRSGKPMIKIFFDFAREDKQSGYFAEQYKNDIRPERKWPTAGTAYVLTEDSDGNCSRGFKTFTTSVERSNSGFAVQWGNAFCACFKGKKVGAVFGVVQNEYKGKVTNQHRLRWFRSTDGVMNVEIPEPRLLPQSAVANAQTVTSPDGFINVPDGIDEELPFN